MTEIESALTISHQLNKHVSSSEVKHVSKRQIIRWREKAHFKKANENRFKAEGGYLGTSTNSRMK